MPSLHSKSKVKQQHHANSLSAVIVGKTFCVDVLLVRAQRPDSSGMQDVSSSNWISCSIQGAKEGRLASGMHRHISMGQRCGTGNTRLCPLRL
mmetsp:Transcript_93056/g.300751  ORF Transcript_93056/g.300751 Transcript_93056/m.300751 type:complete len:93 (+) Transcript_93056:606-884(+)